MDDVRRTAVLFSKLSQFFIEILVFGLPNLAVLGLQDVILSIMNCFICARKRREEKKSRRIFYCRVNSRPSIVNL